MACCFLTAYFMNRIIRAFEVLDLDVLKIQYNQFDDASTLGNQQVVEKEVFNTSKLVIEGMTCAACTTAITTTVSSLKGVERISVSLPLAQATVVHRPSEAPVSSILAAIEDVGYTARQGQRSAYENLGLAEHSQELERLRNAFKSSMTLSSISTSLEWLSGVTALSSYHTNLRVASMALGTWVQIIDAACVHQGVWSKGISNLTMDTLISLSLLLGLAVSFFSVVLFGLGSAQTYFSSGAFLTTVILGGRYLDHLLRRRGSSNLASLYRLQTESMTVRVRKRQVASLDDRSDQPEPNTVNLPAALLRAQDEIIIGQGELVPVDCYVIDGRSMADQATMTGESIPVNKGPGDFLMAGTRNLSSALVAIVTREQQDSALEQLVSSVSTATETCEDDSSVNALIYYFVSLILGLTIIGFCWTFNSTTNTSLSHRLNLACERAMAILASACPCALGLATPSAFMAAIDAAWTRGIIVKGGLQTLTYLTELSHIVMDKTGTLTTGKLSISGSSQELEAWHHMLICVAERLDAQTQPVAQTLFQWSFSQLTNNQRRDQNSIKTRNQASEPGKGVFCEAHLPLNNKWHKIHIGTASYLQEHKITMPLLMPLASAQPTTVHIAFDFTHLTTITLHDTIRPEAHYVVDNLISHYPCTSLTMLTGDVPSEAARVSTSLRIPVLGSQVLPHQKAAYVHSLKSTTTNTMTTTTSGKGGKVAFLGDGLNDTPALSVADVGIFLSPSLASSTSPVFSQHIQPQSSISSVILKSPSLTRLPELLAIAHKTVSAARWIRYWAIAYNIIAVSLAMGALETWGIRVDAARAGTMMALSSVSVLSWGLWLRHNLAQVHFDDIAISSRTQSEM